MRSISAEIVAERKLKILSAIIHHYVKTVKPVGSDVLIEQYGIELSPAAVRNIMAELEKEGLLTHPHTSAGRLPTDLGYRAYVDSIVRIQEFALDQKQQLIREFEQKNQEIEDVLSETSKILSAVSRCMGFVTTPKVLCDIVRTVELISIDPSEILVILITHTGSVKHKRLKLAAEPLQLLRLREFLNAKLRGVPLVNVNEMIIKEVADFARNEVAIVNLAQAVSEAFYDLRDDLFIGGASEAIEREFELPAFDDFASIKSIIKLNKNKERLIEIINKNFDAELAKQNDSNPVSVKIGVENSLQELKDLSMVTTVYKDGDRAVGVLGIIGPKRMEYEKMITLVSGVSKMLNEVLSQSS
ncbi:MAG: heat-inducible transcriptional repressor HrcA [Elusimicrobiota bacterium]|nr:heat-inducible transcriptional repressor HrcA [Elusimicrobiota bacterium]